MKIVFFEFVTSNGGASRSTLELARRLKEHIEVAIIDPYGCCKEFAIAARESGLEYHILYPNGRHQEIGGHGNPLSRLARLVCALWELHRIRKRAVEVLKKVKPDIISSNNFKSAFVIGTVIRLWRVPQIIHLRGWYSANSLPFYSKLLCRKKKIRVIAVSNPTRTALLSSGISPHKIEVLHNSIDVFNMISEAGRPLQSALPLADRPVRICVPGLVIYSKGQHTAVRALPKILDYGYDAVMWIVGDFPKATQRQRAYPMQIVSLAKELGVENRLYLLGERPDLPAIMKLATVILMPTHTEGHPRVLLEAMSLAKPIAATPVGGITDMILPGLTGLFFEVEDDEGLASCVDYLINNKADAEKMGKRAQEYVKNWFKPTQQIEKALKIYRALISPI